MGIEAATRCGKCARMFSYDSERGIPVIAYCSDCDRAIRRNIELRLNQKTGYVRGNYHSLTGFSPEKKK